MAFACLPSFLPLGVPSPSLLKPTRLAADDIQLLLPGVLKDDEGGEARSAALVDLEADCLEEETVGDINRGAFLPRFSLDGVTLAFWDASDAFD